MYFSGEIEKVATRKLADCRTALIELRQYVTTSESQDIVIGSQSTLYEKVPRDGTLFLLKEGTMKCVRGDKIIYFAEEGDIIGFEGSAFDESMDFFAEFAVVLTPIEMSSLFSTKESTSIWNRFQGTFLSAILAGLSQDIQSDRNASPEVKTFLAGDTIVYQGSLSTTVYLLLEGIAESFINEEKYRDIFQDEVIGAVSVLTGNPESASVIAMTDCFVAVLNKEQFIEYANKNPDVYLKMVVELAKDVKNSKQVQL
jgi:CRP-like cAMP-binding protein